MKRIIISILCLTCLFATIVTADEITDRLKAGSDFYNQKKFSDAISEISYALQLIRQKQADELGKYFPAAPSGWKAEEVENEAAAAMFMGGVTAVSRDYNHNSGASVDISMAMDSPLLSSIMMFMSNPMMAGAKRVETIAGERALIDFSNEDKSGEINVVVANKLLLTLNGNDVTLDQLKGFLTSMDLKGLKAFIGS